MTMQWVTYCFACKAKGKKVELIKSKQPGVILECPKCSYQILNLGGSK